MPLRKAAAAGGVPDEFLWGQTFQGLQATTEVVGRDEVGLARYLEDGRIEMDTNAIERAMRPIALNRKNALFTGHDEGAANWACIASLVETCKLNLTVPTRKPISPTS